MNRYLGCLGILICLLLLSGTGVTQGTDATGSADDLDLDALVDRISSSKALGLFTKLSLKRDIDGFLDEVKRYHEGDADESLEELHERYDVMVHKLTALVQDKDTELVQSIDESRDKLWAILSDEAKFARL